MCLAQPGIARSSSDLAATDGISDVEEVTKTDDEEESERLKLRSKLGMPEFDPDEAMVTALPKMLLLD